MACILGIDPGYARCGWAIITDSFTHLDCGVIETKPIHEAYRLLLIYDALNGIIKKYNPSSCGVEKLFFNKNTKTALSVAHSIGVIKLVLAQSNIPHAEYTPAQVKQSITGYGRSPKDQLSIMLKKILPCPSTKQLDDAFDAIAIAVCHTLASPGYAFANTIKTSSQSCKE